MYRFMALYTETHIRSSMDVSVFPITAQDDEDRIWYRETHLSGDFTARPKVKRLPSYPKDENSLWRDRGDAADNGCTHQSMVGDVIERSQ